MHPSQSPQIKHVAQMRRLRAGTTVWAQYFIRPYRPNVDLISRKSGPRNVAESAEHQVLGPALAAEWIHSVGFMGSGADHND